VTRSLAGVAALVAASCAGAPAADMARSRAALAMAPEPVVAPPPPPVAEPATAAQEPPAVDPEPSPPPASACNEQAPQDFLIRGNYTYKAGATDEERRERRRLHRAAIEYRTREYGYVEGHGNPSHNHLEPKHYAKDGRFFGVSVQMNVRVLFALGCVEKAIRETCADSPYEPRVLDGLRLRKTFHNDEVSNHNFGIAIDIDPDRNSCCGCVPPLSEWPRCKDPVSSPFERTEIPRCWVETFERFGFYWLGHDVLEDTMHFEFLGDPDKIVRKAEDSGKAE
jgi:hypothetical protein